LVFGIIVRSTWSVCGDAARCRGEPYVLPALVPLSQAIHHANDHRSQIATLLTHQGIEPPDLDVWAYHDAGMPD